MSWTLYHRCYCIGSDEVGLDLVSAGFHKKFSRFGRRLEFAFCLTGYGVLIKKLN